MNYVVSFPCLSCSGARDTLNWLRNSAARVSALSMRMRVRLSVSTEPVIDLSGNASPRAEVVMRLITYRDSTPATSRKPYSDGNNFFRPAPAIQRGSGHVC
jgi:hypothetical protein